MAEGRGKPVPTTVGGGGDENCPLLESSGEKNSDIEVINSVGDFGREFLIKSKKIWGLAAPEIFTSFCMYGLITISQIFAGHLGNLQLSALSVENNIISGFPSSPPKSIGAAAT
ncbi:hypothetical protein ACS0TY_005619 [Phlomoides rotata]